MPNFKTFIVASLFQIVSLLNKAKEYVVQRMTKGLRSSIQFFDLCVEKWKLRQIEEHAKDHSSPLTDL